MKIAINNICVAPPLTGIGNFTLQMQLTLQAMEDVSIIPFKSIDNFTNKTHNPNPPSKSLNKDKGPFISKTKVIHFLAKFKIFRLLRMVYIKFKFFKFAQRSKKFGSDIYIEPNYFINWNYNPVVPIIYDLSIIRYPETHTKELVKAFQKKLKKSIYESHAIVTISEFSKREILDVFNIQPEKIFVAPCGASDDFKPRTDIEVKKTLDSLDLKYRQFILVIGTFEPRKNLKNICTAYSQLSKELRHQYPLVLCGAKGWGNVDLSENTLELIAKNEIRILDYISDSMLHDLTSSARVSCYISIYEGFGLPVLEAMQSGTPVITSNVSSMPEVAGKAGILISPFNTTEIKSAMESVLTNDELMHNMIDKGLQQAQFFSWQKCANIILKACAYAKEHAN